MTRPRICAFLHANYALPSKYQLIFIECIGLVNSFSPENIEIDIIENL